MRKPVALAFERLPKGDYTPAAECIVDLDEMADLLGVKPKLHTGTDRSGRRATGRFISTSAMIASPF